MKNYFHTLLLAAVLLIAVSPAHAQISIGIRIGPPPTPRVVRVQPSSLRPRLPMDR